MKLHFAAVALLLCSMAAQAAPYQRLPSAAKLKTDIERFGAQEVLVNRIFRNDRVSDALLEQVASGRSEWLTIAIALRPASDAGSSESLIGSLSLALARQPRGVLQILADPSSGFSVTDICSGRLVYLEQPDRETKWHAAAIRKVTSVSDASLQEVRGACLAQLRMS